MEESKNVLRDLPDDLRDEYLQVEAGRADYDKAVDAAQKTGGEPPEPGEGIDTRSTDELQAELEKQQANLEMNMNTNPGVVEQYEKRKRDVSVLFV